MNIKNFKNTKNRLWLAAIAAIFTISSCIHKKTPQKQTQKNETKTRVNTSINAKKKGRENNPKQAIKKEEHFATIWIHGTRAHNLQDYLFTNFFYRKMGLHNVSEYLDKHNMRKIAHIMSRQKTTRFTLENFFFFGWCGQLSHKKRKEAAQELHSTLLQFTDAYKAKHGVIPKIRLITHSHGGNVALNLGKINDKAENMLHISELILLACPVQKKTAKLITSKTFDKVYSLYSGLDILQVIDPQGLHDIKKTIKKRTKKPFFSKRTFKPQQNLHQVKIKINGRGILHVEFLVPKFALLLPYILQEVDNWEKQEKHDTKAYKPDKLLKISIKNDTIKFHRKKLNTRRQG
ncbi:hypothetical protein ACFLYU_03030 [Candidatus Dependentiae bacterium]